MFVVSGAGWPGRRGRVIDVHRESVMLISVREGRAGLPGHQHPAASRLTGAATTAAPPVRLVAIWLPAVLHAGGVDQLRDRLYRLLRHAGSEVVLDGSSVEEISPAAVGVLVAAALLAQRDAAPCG
jgi:STAS domain